MCHFHPYLPVLLFVQSGFRNYSPFFIIYSQIPIQSTPSTPLVCHLPGIFFPLLLFTLHSHSSPTHSTNKRGRAHRGGERLLQVIWCNSGHIVSLQCLCEFHIQEKDKFTVWLQTDNAAACTHSSAGSAQGWPSEPLWRLFKVLLYFRKLTHLFLK